jgi:hypothetical protein
VIGYESGYRNAPDTDIFCGLNTNRPRMGHECPNLRSTNSFTLAPGASAGVREKFVDGFDRLNPAGLG